MPASAGAPSGFCDGASVPIVSNPMSALLWTRPAALFFTARRGRARHRDRSIRSAPPGSWCSPNRRDNFGLVRAGGISPKSMLKRSWATRTLLTSGSDTTSSTAERTSTGRGLFARAVLMLATMDRWVFDGSCLACAKSSLAASATAPETPSASPRSSKNQTNPASSPSWFRPPEVRQSTSEEDRRRSERRDDRCTRSCSPSWAHGIRCWFSIFGGPFAVPRSDGE